MSKTKFKDKHKIHTLKNNKNLNILILSGAGISSESGISTFRGEDGLWEKYKISDICTAGCLDKNRDIVVDFYDNRRMELKECEPNHTHKMIAKLQQKYPDNINIVTQNIDNLFERAGCKDVIHLHGFLQEVICEDNSCNYCRNIGYVKQGLDCPLCGEYIRPNVVFFNEPAPMYQKLDAKMRYADILIVIGTSGKVINVNKLAKTVKYSILNNLIKSDIIDDTLFNNVFYDKATVAIDEIAKVIDEIITKS